MDFPIQSTCSCSFPSFPRMDGHLIYEFIFPWNCHILSQSIFFPLTMIFQKWFLLTGDDNNSHDDNHNNVDYVSLSLICCVCPFSFKCFWICMRFFLRHIFRFWFIYLFVWRFRHPTTNVNLKWEILIYSQTILSYLVGILGIFNEQSVSRNWMNECKYKVGVGKFTTKFKVAFS